MNIKRTSGKQRTLGGVSLMCVCVDGGLEVETSGNRRSPACDAVIPVDAEPHLLIPGWVLCLVVVFGLVHCCSLPPLLFTSG